MREKNVECRALGIEKYASAARSARLRQMHLHDRAMRLVDRTAWTISPFCKANLPCLLDKPAKPDR